MLTAADEETPNIDDMAAAATDDIVGVCENTAVNQYVPGCIFCVNPVISFNPMGFVIPTVPKSASQAPGTPLISLYIPFLTLEEET